MQLSIKILILYLIVLFEQLFSFINLTKLSIRLRLCILFNWFLLMQYQSNLKKLFW